MADNTNNKRRIVICGKGGGTSTVTWDDIQDKPEFATVATSGDYDDLTDKPTIPAAPVQSDWNESDSTSLAYIANKPTILTQWFGTQAEYDLIDPKDPNTVYNIEGSDNVQPDWNQNDTTADDYIKNKPTIPAAPVQSNWNESDSTSLAYIQNKPTVSTDIPEDKNNAIIIYNESGNTTFTQGVWAAGPIPTEIWQNGVKVTGSITSPYPLVNGKNVIMETLNGEPNTTMETFEFADKNATIWVYADYKRYNHPISGTYTGDINVVLNNNEAGHNLVRNSSGVKYWLLDNKGVEIRVTNNNTIILSDKSLQLNFEGTVTSASDFNLTIYVPKTQYNNLVALLQTSFPNVTDLTWFTDHINQYDYIVSDGYKLRMITEPAAQVNSDWNAVSGVAQILNKPAMTTETLTFTLQGGTTQTITVYTQPTI